MTVMGAEGAPGGGLGAEPPKFQFSKIQIKSIYKR